MNKNHYLLLSLLILCILKINAQQDCNTAIPICSPVINQPNAPIGSGLIPNEYPEGTCHNISNESHSAWYIFTTSEEGDLGFNISSNTPGSDYDWVLFNITNSNCADLQQNLDLVVSCNAAYCDGNVTGANGGSNYTNQGANCDSIPPDSLFGFSEDNALVPVLAGQTYVLAINNWNGDNNAGYQLDFTIGDDVGIFDTIAPHIAEITANDTCNATELTVHFSEFIQCSSISESNFVINGPDGLHTVTTINSIDCGNTDADFGSIYNLSVEPAITVSGEYTVELLVDEFSEAIDKCSNPALVETYTMQLGGSLTIEEQPQDAYVCLGDQAVFEVSVPGENLTYEWYFNETLLDNNDSILIVDNVDEFSLGLYSAIIYSDCDVAYTEAAELYASTFTSNDFDVFEASCDSAAFGQITFTPNNIIAPYQLLWSNNDSTEQISGLESGDYTLSVTDSIGCLLTNTVTINNTDGISLNVVVNNPICDETTGSANAIPSGGVPPYTFTWSDSFGDVDFVDELIPGTYSVTVVGSEGCSDSTIFVVEEPNQENCDSTLSTACFNVYAGEDQFLACEDSIINLGAIYPLIGVGSDYEVEEIPYEELGSEVPPIDVPLNTDDTWSGVIDLPFEFNFYETNYNQIVFGTNGILTFDISRANQFCEFAFGASIPDSSIYDNSIYGVYHDIDPSAGDGGEITYKVIGEEPCRKFIVEYKDVNHFSCISLESTTQIILNETTNTIEVFVKDKPTCQNWNNGNALIGIQKEGNLIAHSPPNRNTGPWSTSNEAWRFTPISNTVPNLTWYNNGDVVATGDSVTIIPGDLPAEYVFEVSYDLPTGLITLTDTVLVEGDTNCCTYSVYADSIDCSTDTFCVYLKANEAVNSGIIGMNYCLNYDTSIMQATGTYSLGEVVYNQLGSEGSGEEASLNTNVPGYVYTSIYYGSDVPQGTQWEGSGNVICIEFVLTEDPDTGVFPLTVCEIEESYPLEEVSACVENGTVVLDFNTTIDCQVVYWDYDGEFNFPAKPLIYDEENPADYLMTSASDLTESINSNTNLEGVLSWDINDGNQIKISRDIQGTYNDESCTDVFLYINGADAYYASLIANFNLVNALEGVDDWSPSPFQMIAADVNMNDKVRANDVTLIMDRSVQNICEYPQIWNYTAGTIDNPQPPVEGAELSLDWRFLDRDFVYGTDAEDSAVVAEYTLASNYPVYFSNNVVDNGYWRDNVPNVPEYLTLADEDENCDEYENKTFYAVLLGDLNNSWESEPGKGVKVGSFAEVHYHAVPQNNGTYKVSVSATSEEEMHSLDFKVDYNAYAMSANNLQNTIEANALEVQKSWNVVNTANNEVLYLNAYSLNILSNGADLLEFTVQPTNGSLTASDFGEVTSLVNGSVATTSITIEDESTNIADQMSQQGFVHVYPNPSEGIFTIEMGVSSKEQIQIEVFNGIGEVVYKNTIYNNQQVNRLPLDLSGMSTGVYQLNIHSGGFSAHEKLYIK